MGNFKSLIQVISISSGTVQIMVTLHCLIHFGTRDIFLFEVYSVVRLQAAFRTEPFTAAITGKRYAFVFRHVRIIVRLHGESLGTLVTPETEVPGMSLVMSTQSTFILEGLVTQWARKSSNKHRLSKNESSVSWFLAGPR